MIRSGALVVELAAGLIGRQRELVALEDAVDLEQVRIGAAGQGLAREYTGHELVVTGAEVGLVGLQRDLSIFL